LYPYNEDFEDKSWSDGETNSTDIDLDTKPRRRRDNKCAVTSCGIATILFLFMAVAFRPRYPLWEVNKVTFGDGVIKQMVQAFTNKSFDQTVTIPVDAEAEVENPNRIGAHVLGGQLSVTHQGVEIATVELLEGDCPARGIYTQKAHATSVISTPVRKHLQANLPKDFMMTVQIKGEANCKVESLWNLGITATVQCYVDVNLLQVVQDPNRMVIGHRCSYGIKP